MAPPAVGCESQTALDAFVRVALASEEVLLVVDLTAELAEPELGACVGPGLASER